VNVIVTEMAVISVTPNGLRLDEIAPGLTVADVQNVTQPKLIVSETLRPIRV
jgi:3-oxoacid CoA-transferase subunit B